MSVADPKSKILSFRLSNAEYDAIEKASHLHGFRSMALFARSAVLAFQPTANTSPLEVNVVQLWGRLQVLASEVENLAARLGVVLDPEVPSQPAQGNN
jgi:hypothetical protein